MARVEEVFSLIRNGASIKQMDAAEGIPITRIETISDREVNRNRFGYADVFELGKYADYVLQDKDILMSHINSEKHLGKVALYQQRPGEVIIHGMNLLVLRPKKEVLLPEYALLFFNSFDFLDQIKAITKKSVNQASFSISALKQLEIKVPALKTQEIVAKRIGKLERLICLRKQQLEKLDELVKARFVEMFSESLSNPEPLRLFLEDITYGFTNPMPDAQEGPWKVTAKDVVNGRVNYETARKTTSKAFNELTDKSKPKIGDVLLTKDGTLGRCAVVDVDGICVNQSVAVLKCNEKILPKFLTLLLQMPEYQREMLKNAGGGTIKHIYITKVVDMLIIVPTISQQLEFLSFVEQTEKTKVRIKKSLDELEILKKALMQKYFG